MIGQTWRVEHLADVEHTVETHPQRLRAIDVTPVVLQAAVSIEHLQAIVLAIGDVDILIAVDDDPVMWDLIRRAPRQRYRWRSR